MRPDTTITEAEREAADAAHELDALKERVREGDTTVTPERIAAQQQVVDFATLRVEAAKRSAARLREDERQQLAEQARQAAQHLMGEEGSADVVAAVMASVEATAELRRVVDAHNAQVAAVGAVVAKLSNSLTGEGTTGSQATRPYGVWGDDSHIVVEKAGHATKYSAGELAAAAFLVGLGTDAASPQHEAQARGLLNGLTNQAIGRVGRDVPGLADAWRTTPQEWQAASQRGRYRASEQGRRPLPDQD
jgi:hypothetical protein